MLCSGSLRPSGPSSFRHPILPEGDDASLGNTRSLVTAERTVTADSIHAAACEVEPFVFNLPVRAVWTEISCRFESTAEGNSHWTHPWISLFI